MSDLETSLRELGRLDLGSVDADRLASGARRLARRRRRARGGAALALLLLAGLGAAAELGRTGADRTVTPVPAGPSPLPVPRTVGFDSATSADATPLSTTTRTLQLDPANDMDSDRYVGLTDDGLVVRSVVTANAARTTVSLIDPETGRVDPLPAPPSSVGELRALSLTANRLVFLVAGHTWADSSLSFDRTSRQWSLHRLEAPDNPGHWLGYEAKLGPDDRIYLSADTDVSRQWWWSVPVTGGVLQRENDLEGREFAWLGDEVATIDRAGRVTLTQDGTTRAVASAPPKGCTPPVTTADAPTPSLDVSGAFLLVTFTCREGRQVVVLDDQGRALFGLPVTLVSHVATGSDGAVIAVGERQDLYYLDPGSGQLWSLGRHAHEDTPATTSGALILWNEPGPTDSDKVYDVVYHVARHP